MVFVCCSFFTRQCYGDLADRVSVVRRRDGQHTNPRIRDSSDRGDVCFRTVGVVRSRVAVRLPNVSDRRRRDTNFHWTSNDIHTGIAVLLNDGGQTGSRGQVSEDAKNV